MSASDPKRTFGSGGIVYKYAIDDLDCREAVPSQFLSALLALRPKRGLSMIGASVSTT